jgi:hypothetical protein
MDTPLIVPDPVMLPPSDSVFPLPTFIETLVPLDAKIASIVSRFVFNLLPQVSVDAPTSGLVKLRLVVVVSAI